MSDKKVSQSDAVNLIKAAAAKQKQPSSTSHTSIGAKKP
jgi:hypothetical protein